MEPGNTQSRTRKNRGHQPAGFTLLEVLLAMAISVVVLSLVGTGIRLHLRMLDTQRSGIEQAKLARAILNQISRDLRSAVQPSDCVTSSGSSTESATSGSVGQGDEADATDGADDGSPAAGESDMDEAALSESIDPQQQTCVGLYGSWDQLRFESCRAAPITQLPTDELTQADFISFVPQSELRTVSYFLGMPSAVTRVASAPIPTDDRRTPIATVPSNTPVLMRLVLDHAMHTYLVENGGTEVTQNYAEVLAEEVYQLTFRYCDGLQWLEEWDSTAQGGLPVAVEVTLALQPPRSDTDDPYLAVPTLTETAAADLMFQTVIRLPTGQVTDDTEAQY